MEQFELLPEENGYSHVECLGPVLLIQFGIVITLHGRSKLVVAYMVLFVTWKT